MLEYEKKFMLTEDEYNSIKKMYGELPSDTQKNYYFDTDDLAMNKLGITYRIRKQNGIYKATIKDHSTDYADCSVELHLTEKNELDPIVFSDMGLKYQGTLTTNRMIIYKDSFCEVVLDFNTYLGFTDYELEIEYMENYEQKAIILLKDIATELVTIKLIDSVDLFLARENKGKCKSQRFYDRKMIGGD